MLASITLEAGGLIVYGTVDDDLIELIGGADYQSLTVRINDDPSLTQTFSYSEVSNVTVFAHRGNDRVTNTLLRDTVIYGGAGDDIIQGGFREDWLYGGEGEDTLTGRNGNDRLYGYLGDDRLFGGNGDDLLLGGSSDDYLHGGSGNDQLLGNDGNDRLLGDLGDDRLSGNAGNDRLDGNDGSDEIRAGAGNDVANGGTGVDRIFGNSGTNTLNGNEDDDQIHGGREVDYIFGESGADLLVGLGGNDVLVGGVGDDHLIGNTGDDLLNGNSGNDQINAGVGNDTVNGGLDDDLIFGISGTNFLFGNGGNDRISGGISSDEIDGGDGDDILLGNGGSDRLVGNFGADKLYGGDDDDILEGGFGKDFLYSQRGDDELRGSSGDDVLNGGDGADFVRYVADSRAFDVQRDVGGYRAADIRTGNQASYGSDFLIDVEELAFGEPSIVDRQSVEDSLSSVLDLAAINELLPNGWRSTYRTVGNDIWMRTVNPSGAAEFDFRIGAAGAISELRDATSGESLLAPTFQGEVTDRVLQWTLWESGRTVRHDLPSLPTYEDRFNQTQAGTFDNVLHGTVDVEIEGGQINVWSVADRNWKSQQDPYMDGTITSLTQMTILDGGGVLLRRVIRIGEIRLRGQEVSLAAPYFEAWNPLSEVAFNAMALSINGNGAPDEVLLDGAIPTYPEVPVQDTRGWVLGYDRFDRTGGNNLALIFGTDIGTVYRTNGAQTSHHKYVRNSLDFNGGWAVLPGLRPGPLDEGAIIEQHLILLPGDTINASTAARLDGLAEQLPAPRVFHSGEQTYGDLAEISDRLETLADEPHFRSDHLAGLL